MSLSPSRLEAQHARAILLEPGKVNASVAGASWWLANQSIVVTWSTAGGGIRLASVYDRLGGRTAPAPGETFTVRLPDGGAIAGSAFRVLGTPSVADLPAAPAESGSDALEPGKVISARLTSGDNTLGILWRAELRAGGDGVRQTVTVESGRGEAAVTAIAMSGAPRSPLPAGPAPPAAVLAGPYLQNPGPSSITVMWITDNNAAGWSNTAGAAPSRRRSSPCTTASSTATRACIA